MDPHKDRLPTRTALISALASSKGILEAEGRACILSTTSNTYTLFFLYVRPAKVQPNISGLARHDVIN